jgi:glycosyltransferase involved in cell wall biosynthesis
LSCRRDDVEIVVVDDGSTVSYKNVREYYGDRLTYRMNSSPMGVASSRNRGALLAAGRWLVFLDDDDELADGYLGRIEEIVGSQRDVAAVWTGARIIKKTDGRVRAEEKTFPARYGRTKHLIKDLLSVGLGFGFAVDRAVFNEAGMFDETFSVGEDTELFFRLLANDCIPQPVPGVGVVKHEEHPERLSSDFEFYSRDDIYGRIFERYRDSVCEKWKYNYLHLLMWSYCLHRYYGNRAFEQNALDELARQGVPQAHVDECYRAGHDLSIEHIE